jgi:hypothetical protein
MSPWMAVDFDGTISHYDSWQGPAHVGAPIPKMVERVKAWLAEGLDVRIFTARVYPLLTVWPNTNIDQLMTGYEAITPAHVQAVQAVFAIQKWCEEHIGKVLPITCVKDYGMLELYDDRAVQVEKNTGELVGASTRSL